MDGPTIQDSWSSERFLSPTCDRKGFDERRITHWWIRTRGGLGHSSREDWTWGPGCHSANVRDHYVSSLFAMDQITQRSSFDDQPMELCGSVVCLSELRWTDFPIGSLIVRSRLFEVESFNGRKGTVLLKPKRRPIKRFLRQALPSLTGFRSFKGWRHIKKLMNRYWQSLLFQERRVTMKDLQVSSCRTRLKS